MQQLKIVFTGPMGAGKTRAVTTLSDEPVVLTETMNTDLAANSKTTTTVGMDYGELVLEGGSRVGLIGTPGQARFEFMWSILTKGALGVVILIDHSAEDPVADLAYYMKAFDTVYDGRVVVGVSHVDVAPERPLSIYRDWCRANHKNMPLFAVDVRERDDVLLLVESIITSLEQFE